MNEASERPDKPVTKFQATQISLGRMKDPRKIGRSPNPILEKVTIRADQHEDQAALWEEANAVLRRWAESCPPDEIAEFVILYEDGEKYDGTVILSPPETEEREWLEYHIRAFHRTMVEQAKRAIRQQHFQEAVDDLTKLLLTHQIGGRLDQEETAP
jgi:hypothetical protein